MDGSSPFVSTCTRRQLARRRSAVALGELATRVGAIRVADGGSSDLCSVEAWILW